MLRCMTKKEQHITDDLCWIASETATLWWRDWSRRTRS